MCWSYNSYSEFFKYAVGLRQGEVISPVLFSLFVEDLELFLQDDINSGVNIDDIILILLLFADDMVLLGKTPDEINTNLILLSEYCKLWSLEVNVQKTKVMVFRKRGGLRNNETFVYNGTILEVVNDFNYLITVFNYTGSFALNQQQLVGKALKSMNVLLVKCQKYKMKPKILCQLFDSFVGSVLNYSSEIWGFTKSKEIERIHLKFCKKILFVKMSTPNVAVYDELGRYPVYISSYIRILKFWFKLNSTENIILKTVYNMSYNDCINGKKNWVSNVKKLLCENGYNYVFDNPHFVKEKPFLSIFRQQLIDCFLQGWHSNKSGSTMLNLYHHLKEKFEYERYLDLLPFDLRTYLVKLRVSAHSLRVQTNRYGINRLPRNERVCLFCDTRDIDDEFHFVFKCPCFNDIRRLYIDRYYYIRPNMHKLIELLNCREKDTLVKLCKFSKIAFNRRNKQMSQNI